AKGEELVRGEIMPPLEKLGQDDDVDVRFFATTAAKSWTDHQAQAHGQGSAMET
ncbi:hypothetical protein KC336_g17853, partial [Hortaea werneckii]